MVRANIGSEVVIGRTFELKHRFLGMFGTVLGPEQRLSVEHADQRLIGRQLDGPLGERRAAPFAALPVSRYIWPSSSWKNGLDG